MQELESKQAKLASLKKAKGKCEACGKPANNIQDCEGELIVLCFNCNRIILGRISFKNVYVKLYGSTRDEIAEQLQIKPSYVYYLHHFGRLEEALKSGKVKRKTNTSLYRRLYGFTIKEIAKKACISQGQVYNLHRDKKLEEFLAQRGFFQESS